MKRLAHRAAAWYRADSVRALRLRLGLSFAANALYALINAVYGFLNHSYWFGTLAVYYICLALMRALAGTGTAVKNGWRLCRACGALLCALNVVLAGVVVLTLKDGHAFSYAGNLIYAMAAYAFYALISAAVQLARSRRGASSALLTSRALSLAAALVSMLSLEIALLARFGSETEIVTFVIPTGAGILLLNTALGAALIVRASREKQSGKAL